jgi:multiple sugar transport system ATP-binding protein
MNLIEREGGSMGFRPENFLPKKLLNGAAVVEFPFRVDRVEYLGSSTSCTAPSTAEPRNAK